MEAGFRIRPIGMNDIQGVKRVAELTWNNTYGMIYTIHFINAFLAQAYSRNNLEAAVLRDEKRENRKFLVAEVDLEIVAYAQMSETKEGEAELLRIYTLPEFQGRGIGKALLEELTKTDKTMMEIFAWVEKENKSGTSFYESMDFRCEGEKEETLEEQVVRLNKYVKHLT